MRLDDVNGDTIASSDRQKSLAALVGAALGVDWQLFPSSGGRVASWGIVLTTGVKRLYTGPMDRIEFAAGPDARALATPAHDALRLWVPFFAATIAIDSRAEARDASHPPTPAR